MGYYDRSFSLILNKPTLPKPKLVGLAYNFQYIEHITVQPWNVDLDWVITEQQIYYR